MDLNNFRSHADGPRLARDGRRPSTKGGLAEQTRQM